MIYITHEYRCDAQGCKAVRKRTWPHYPSDATEKPCAPDGWIKIGARLYCPKHTLVLEIDRTAHTGQQVNLKEAMV